MARGRRKARRFRLLWVLRVSAAEVAARTFERSQIAPTAAPAAAAATAGGQ